MPMGDPEKLGIDSLKPPGLWRLDPDDYTGMRRRLIRALQMITLVIRDFWYDHCLLHAAALTFTTILSLVPFFALTFALLKGFGVQNRLEPLILERVTAGSQEVVSRIITYINNTNMGSLGAIGLTALIITILSLLGSIEEAFNAIWGVREDRSFSRKFSNYLGVMVSAPLLILAAVSITTSMENQAVMRWILDREYIGNLLLASLKLIPYVSVWVAFTFLYLCIPNTRVRLTSAIVGGVLAGTIWQVAQWGYIHFQVGVGRYNAIYGTLSLLPIFMIWLYTSWIIVLFGVEVSYAHQNRRTLRLEYHGKSLSHAARLELALTLLVECSASFRRGGPRTAEQMAAGLNLPVRQVKELLGELEQVGFLSRLAGDNPEWHPAREPASVTVSEVLERLGMVGGTCLIPQAGRCEELIRKVLAQAATGSEAALEGVTIGALADLLEEDYSPDPERKPAATEEPRLES